MIEITGHHHVSLVVTDLERARTFYRDVLGLEEIERPAFDFAGAWFRVGYGQLHLIVHPAARTARSAGAGIDSRDRHFALRVRSYDDTVAHLRALGVPCVEKPVNRTGQPQVFVCDPDGNIIELNAEANPPSR
jgi:glyoxylase I family protein